MVVGANRGQELRVCGLDVIGHQHIVTLHPDRRETHIKVFLFFVLSARFFQGVESLRLERRILVVLNIALQLP